VFWFTFYQNSDGTIRRKKAAVHHIQKKKTRRQNCADGRQTEGVDGNVHVRIWRTSFENVRRYGLEKCTNWKPADSAGKYVVVRRISENGQTFDANKTRARHKRTELFRLQKIYHIVPQYNKIIRRWDRWSEQWRARDNRVFFPTRGKNKTRAHTHSRVHPINNTTTVTTKLLRAAA